LSVAALIAVKKRQLKSGLGKKLMKRFGDIFRRWRNNNEGVTAVEFSLLAVPFIFFTIGIIELSMMYVAASMLNGAVNDAARMIRTGQVQQAQGQSSLNLFQQALCTTAGILLDCNAFQYQVEKIDSFSDADMSAPAFDKNGNLLTQPFDPGGSDDIILIRVVYLYPLMTPFIGALMADYPNNKKLLMSTIVIENEPYQFNG
jgi:Flp pilus assembly protein TadG